MQFTTKTLLVLFVVLASSFAAFEQPGIFVAFVCVIAVCFTAYRGCGCVTVCLAVVIMILFIFVMLVPAFWNAREVARRCGCISNMKRIGMALLIYHDSYGCFPPACVADDEGKRMHSWRTYVLPYLDENSAYQEYKFNEPWDGPNNSKLAARITWPIHCPSAPHEKRPHAHYVAVTGPGTAWPEGRGSRIDEFTDGARNTILLVELSDSDIQWMEPRDVTLDEALGTEGGNATVPRSNHHNEGGYWFRPRPIAGNVLTADGSVHTIKGRLTRDDLAALLTIAGGEKINIEEIIEHNPSEGYSLDYFRWEHGIGFPLFILSLIWFWRRLVADSRLKLPDGEVDQATADSMTMNNHGETES